jgi:hypothetical protein
MRLLRRTGCTSTPNIGSAMLSWSPASRHHRKVRVIKMQPGAVILPFAPPPRRLRALPNFPLPDAPANVGDARILEHKIDDPIPDGAIDRFAAAGIIPNIETTYGGVVPQLRRPPLRVICIRVDADSVEPLKDTVNQVPYIFVPTVAGWMSL